MISNLVNNMIVCMLIFINTDLNVFNMSHHTVHFNKSLVLLRTSDFR